jgi:hypothetical protein
METNKRSKKRKQMFQCRVIFFLLFRPGSFYSPISFHVMDDDGPISIHKRSEKTQYLPVQVEIWKKKLQLPTPRGTNMPAPLGVPPHRYYKLQDKVSEHPISTGPEVDYIYGQWPCFRLVNHPPNASFLCRPDRVATFQRISLADGTFN